MPRSLRRTCTTLVVLAALIVPIEPGAIAIAAACTDIWEPNDTLETAASLGGLPVTPTSCDDDWFKVDAFAGQDLVVDLSHTSADGDLDLEVRDSVGVVMAATTAGSDRHRIVFEVTTSGKHYLRVFAHDGAADGNSYALSMRRDGGLYVPLTQPVRILDTRTPADGLPLGLANGDVTPIGGGGTHGIPVDAVALSATVTVTGHTSAGYVTVAAGLSGAPTTSTVNVPVGDTRANGVVIALGSQGSFAARWSGAAGSRAHLLIDVTGYFRTKGDGGVFVPTGPTRLLDTRTGNGLRGRFPSGSVRTFDVAGRNGIPQSATAIAGNLTVVGPTSGGYVSLGPTMTATPSTSTINVPAGDTRASGVTLGLSPAGGLKAVWKGKAGSSAHLLLDVTGYFVDGPDGAAFYPIDAHRVLDTRIGAGLAGPFTSGAVRKVRVTEDPVPNEPSVPHEAVAMTGNLTAVRPSSAGYVSIGPSMTASPSTSTLNAPEGDIRANGVTITLSDSGSISAVWKGAGGSGTHLLLDATGYYR